MVQETDLRVEQLVWPVFFQDGRRLRTPIPSLPGVERYSLDTLLPEVEKALELGIRSLALFPKIDEAKKDPFGGESLNENNINLVAIRELKKRFPELVVISDVALDPYSSDGHDGVVRDGRVLNDESVELLAAMAVAQARAGADFVAPSDMMDGRILSIRRALDGAGFTETGILSYAAKYASSLYGPFREALDSAPRAGDKKTYQMDVRNSREAIREVRLDVQEGADIVMVKPAGLYLDVIQAVRGEAPVPVAAYQVSGEYAMIQAAAEKGWGNGAALMEESLIAIRRAGADLIFTYFARGMAERLVR